VLSISVLKQYCVYCSMTKTIYLVSHNDIPIAVFDSEKLANTYVELQPNSEVSAYTLNEKAEIVKQGLRFFDVCMWMNGEVKSIRQGDLDSKTYREFVPEYRVGSRVFLDEKQGEIIPPYLKAGCFARDKAHALEIVDNIRKQK
jgi:hypothetical protein